MALVNPLSSHTRNNARNGAGCIRATGYNSRRAYRHHRSYVSTTDRYQVRFRPDFEVTIDNSIRKWPAQFVAALEIVEAGAAAAKKAALGCAAFAVLALNIRQQKRHRAQHRSDLPAPRVSPEH